MKHSITGVDLAKDVIQDDLSSNIPTGVKLLLQGPSEDFILGRIFEGAIGNALDKIFTTDGEYNPKRIREQLAKTEFRHRNCALIGK